MLSSEDEKYDLLFLFRDYFRISEYNLQHPTKEKKMPLDSNSSFQEAVKNWKIAVTSEIKKKGFGDDLLYDFTDVFSRDLYPLEMHLVDFLLLLIPPAEEIQKDDLEIILNKKGSDGLTELKKEYEGKRLSFINHVFAESPIRSALKELDPPSFKKNLAIWKKIRDPGKERSWLINVQDRKDARDLIEKYIRRNKEGKENSIVSLFGVLHTLKTDLFKNRIDSGEILEGDDLILNDMEMIVEIFYNPENNKLELPEGESHWIINLPKKIVEKFPVIVEALKELEHTRTRVSLKKLSVFVSGFLLLGGMGLFLSALFVQVPGFYWVRNLALPWSTALVGLACALLSLVWVAFSALGGQGKGVGLMKAPQEAEGNPQQSSSAPLIQGALPKGPQTPTLHFLAGGVENGSAVPVPQPSEGVDEEESAVSVPKLLESSCNVGNSSVS